MPRSWHQFRPRESCWWYEGGRTTGGCIEARVFSPGHPSSPRCRHMSLLWRLYDFLVQKVTTGELSGKHPKDEGSGSSNSLRMTGDVGCRKLPWGNSRRPASMLSGENSCESLRFLKPSQKTIPVLLSLMALVINPLGSFGDSLSIHSEGRRSPVEGNSKSCHRAFLMGNMRGHGSPSFAFASRVRDDWMADGIRAVQISDCRCRDYGAPTRGMSQV
jgi:hypothetical protein